MLLLSGLLGAIIGSVVTASFNVWKFHRDELSSRIDELCQAMAVAADRASDYWSQYYSTPSFEQAKAEAKLAASQNLVDGLYAEIRGSLAPTDAEHLDDLMSSFVDAMTGGTFTEAGRQADATRIALAPQLSSMIIVAVRRSHRRTLPFRRIIKGFQAYKRHQAQVAKLD